MPFQVQFTPAKGVNWGNPNHGREPDGRDCTMTDEVEGMRTTNTFLPSPKSTPSPFCEKAPSISLRKRDNQDNFGDSLCESWVPHRNSLLVGRHKSHHHPPEHQRHQNHHHDLLKEAQRVVFHPTQHPPQVHEFDWKVEFRPTTTVGSKRKASEKDDDDVNMEEEEDSRPPHVADAVPAASTIEVFPAPPTVSHGSIARLVNPFRRQFSQRQEDRHDFDRPTKRSRKTTNQDLGGENKSNEEHRDRHHRHKQSLVRSRDSENSSTNNISTTIPPNSILRKKSSFGAGVGSAARMSMYGSLDMDLNTTLDSTKSNNDDFSRDDDEYSRKRIRIVESKMTVVQRMTGSLLSFAGRRQRGRRHHRHRRHGTGHRHRSWQRLGRKDDKGDNKNDDDEDEMMDESTDPSGSSFWGDMPSIVSSSYSSVASSKAAIHNVQSSLIDSTDDNDDHSWMPPPNIRNSWKNKISNNNNNMPPLKVRGVKHFLSGDMPMVKPDPLGSPPAISTSTTINIVAKWSPTMADF